LFYNTALTSETGDSLLAVYDFKAQTVLLSYAEYLGEQTPAYNRSGMLFNMTELFSL